MILLTSVMLINSIKRNKIIYNFKIKSIFLLILSKFYIIDVLINKRFTIIFLE